MDGSCACVLLYGAFQSWWAGELLGPGLWARAGPGDVGLDRGLMY